MAATAFTASEATATLCTKTLCSMNNILMAWDIAVSRRVTCVNAMRSEQTSWIWPQGHSVARTNPNAVTSAAKISIMKNWSIRKTFRRSKIWKIAIKRAGLSRIRRLEAQRRPHPHK